MNTALHTDYKVQRPIPSSSGTSKEDLMKSAKELEKTFITQIFEQLFSLTDVVEKSHGEEMFQSIKVDIFADQVCKKESFGLSKLIYKDLCKQNGMSLEDIESRKGGYYA